MDHYRGINADERWKNDLLNELRESNRINRELIETLSHNAQMAEPQESSKPKDTKRKYTRRVG